MGALGVVDPFKLFPDDTIRTLTELQVKLELLAHYCQVDDYGQARQMAREILELAEDA